MNEPRTERRLTTILAADVAGYSRLTGADEERTLARLKALRHELIDPAIASARGRVVKTMGDGILIEFPSAVDAVRCAIDVQRGMVQRNSGLAPEQRIEFRVGIHVGDVVVDGSDLLGDGVNIAARIEGISENGGISISEDVWRQVQGKVTVNFADLGEQSLKNIARPVRVYRVDLGEGSATQLTAAALALPDKPSIAVLPFQNMSGDPEQDYFADGMAEDIITGLSRVRRFFVIARNSTFTYKGRAIDIKQVARELGVRYVLEGSVRSTGGRVRVTVQLIDAATGNHIWADRYDRALSDIFAVQDEITEKVVAIVEPQLYVAEERRVTRKLPESLDAWECVVRALMILVTREQRSFPAARALLNRAIALDAKYSQAYSVLAYALATEAFYGWTSYSDAIPEAVKAANLAVMLDGEDPWAHFAMGFVVFMSGRPLESITAQQKALALNPSFVQAHEQLTAALTSLGRCEEALAECDAAERLNPRGFFAGINQMTRSYALFSGGRYAEGAACARRSVQESPGLVSAHRALMLNAAMAGDSKEAQAALMTLKRLVPDFTFERAKAHAERIWANEDARARMIEAYRLAGLE